jgi:type VI secretion system protein ImpK
MLKAMHASCADLILAVALLRDTEDRELPQPEVMRQLFRGALDEMRGRAVAAQILKDDIESAQYALAALIDERFVHAHSWPGQLQWSNQRLSDDPNYGQGFFMRLRDLIHAESSQAHVVLVYFYCLALGFEGKYHQQQGSGWRQAFDDARSCLRAAQPGAATLSPNGLRAPPPARARRQRWASARLEIVGFVAVCLVVLLLRVLMSSATADTLRALRGI